MPAIRISKDYFSGNGRLFGKDGLGEVIRGLAIDHARNKVGPANVPALTDNTTGAAAASVVDLVLPTAPFDATSAGGAQRAAYNTAVGKINNAGKVLSNSVNDVRALLGLDSVTHGFGTEATPDTLPALDKVVTEGNGNTALDYESGLASMKKVKANQRKLLRAVNEVFVALGEDPVSSSFKGSVGSDLTAADPGTAAASATGASAISKAVMDTFLDSVADNFATIADKWNDIFDGSGFVTDRPLHIVAS